MEKTVLALAEVHDCAVIGVPDEKWGEMVTAVVVLKDGETLSEADIIAHCKEALGSVKAPKKIHFWDALPTTAVGKLN